MPRSTCHRLGSLRSFPFGKLRVRMTWPSRLRRSDTLRHMRRLLVLSVLFAANVHAQTVSLDQRVDKLLARMTLEEKLGQLSQYVMDQPEWLPAREKGLVGSILNGGDARRIN